MKPLLLLIIIISGVSYAQSGKDSVLSSKKELPSGLSKLMIKQDTSKFTMRKFLVLNKILTYTLNYEYLDEMHKRALKEEIDKVFLTPMQQAQENLKQITKEIQFALEDKRSWWQKLLEDFLGIAKYVAAIALAVKTLLK